MNLREVQKHFSKFPTAQAKALLETFKIAMQVLPGAEIDFAWGMPTLKISGVNALHIEGFKSHNSFFPGSGSVAALVEKEVKGLKVTKGSIHFDAEKAMPAALVKKIIKIRIDQINATYPLKNGDAKLFYGNGYLKAEGKYKGKELHGAWKWYRNDGSIMRSGFFKNGIQSGTWVTYDRRGAAVKETNF